jgi:hypothetical protein
LTENTDGLLDDKAVLHYDWRCNKATELTRGRALIFRDKNHCEASLKMAESFEHLNYLTRTLSVDRICTVLGKHQFRPLSRGLKCNFYVHAEGKSQKICFDSDGSFALCLLTNLKESEMGLCCEVKGRDLYLSEIVDAFSGLICPQLAGKPKLFFFLDQNAADIDPQLKIDGDHVDKVSIFLCSLNWFTQLFALCL